MAHWEQGLRVLLLVTKFLALEIPKALNIFGIFFLSRLRVQCGAQHGAWTHDPEIQTW